ncbi:MAG: hypothetical protein HYV26_04670 [Candidatus Hydrogenedentes bacterium]|nr:hypothetical protein [Candidatus Hydrogenedentota bacterium]
MIQRRLRAFTAGVYMVVAVLLLLPAAAIAAESLDISEGPQLFLDDFLLQRMENVKRVVQEPVKHARNPVVVPEHPWEKRVLEIYGTVLYDGALEKYRCWYLANEFKDGIPNNPQDPRTAEYYTCYAESADGISWTKPMVGKAPFGTHAQHNVVIENTHGFCVLPTPDDPDPRRRYKGAGGATYGFSPDGLTWDTRNWRETVGKNDTSTCVVRWRGEYLAFVRAQVSDPAWPAVMRGVGLSTSKDFEHWTPKETVLTTDAQDGYPWVQPYGISVTPYGDVLIGILWLLHLDQTPGNNSLGDMDTQLVVSRDGRAWQRVADRAPFLRPTPNTWDTGRVFPGTTMIVKDGAVRIYYTGVSTRHGEGWGSMGIGLATLPEDRFVAVTAADPAQPAVIETRPITFSGNTLLLNAETKERGVLVEVLGADGAPLPGFAQTHCILTPHDNLRHRVTWQEGGHVRSLPDAAGTNIVALRFIIRDASLYAFQIDS